MRVNLRRANINRLKPSLRVKLVFANTLIMLVVAVAGIGLARHYDFLHGVLILGLTVVCFAVAVVTSGLILQSYLRPLLDFRNALESLQESTYSSIVVRPNSDPTIGSVIHSVREVFNRMEDSSLRHTTLLLNSVEGERQRIGRELHDQTCQTLATALLHLKMADDAMNGDAADAREKLVVAKQLIEHSLEQIKVCVYDLRPIMLDDFGLVPALRWHIKTHMAGTGIEVEADFEDATTRAPRNIETTLYRVAQEALANTIRHAHATRVYIRLETQKEYVVLKISDNGNGFDIKQANRAREDGGLGLHTIKERIKLAKGTLNIQSEAGMGTRISVVVPIPAHPSSLR